MKHRGRRFSGFTILETILCMAIIAMLVAITMPSLKRVNLASEETAARSALRHSAVATLSYAADHRGSFPFLVPEGSNQPTSFAGMDMLPNNVDYFFDQTRYWVTAVTPWFSGVPRVGSEPVFRPVEFEGATLQFSRIWMTSTAFAAPKYWETDEVPNDNSLFRGTRLSEMKHPARKGILMDMISGILHPSQADMEHPTLNYALVATGDGAVAAFAWPPPVETVLRPGAINWPVMSTRGGIAAEDFPSWR